MSTERRSDLVWCFLFTGITHIIALCFCSEATAPLRHIQSSACHSSFLCWWLLSHIMCRFSLTLLFGRLWWRDNDDIMPLFRLRVIWIQEIWPNKAEASRRPLQGTENTRCYGARKAHLCEYDLHKRPRETGKEVSMVTQTANFTELTIVRSWGKNIIQSLWMSGFNSKTQHRGWKPTALFSISYKLVFHLIIILTSDVACWEDPDQILVCSWTSVGDFQYILPKILCIIFATASKNAPTTLT